MRVYFRLLVMISASVAIMLALATFAFMGINSQRTALERICQTDIKDLETAAMANYMAISINCQVYKVFNLMRAGADSKAVEKESAKIDGELQGLEAQFNLLVERANKDAEAHEQAGGQIKEASLSKSFYLYRAAIKNAMDIAKGGDPEIAAMIMLGAETHFKSFEAELESMAKRIKEATEESYYSTAKTHARMSKVFVAGISAGILLLLWISISQSRAIAKPLKLAAKCARLVALGNIKGASALFGSLPKGVVESLSEDSKDEIASLLCSIMKMTENLNALVGKVQSSTMQIASSATEIARSSKEQEATVAEFGASANQIASSSREITATSQQLVVSMDGVAEVSGGTAKLADGGHESLERMRAAMEKLASGTDSISAKLSAINERASSINKVVEAISKVADQTDMLSLNAGIEAEKAGDYGKGFSVVAREIRRLADQTAMASLDIAKMVSDMQSAVASGVMEMDKFSEEMRQVLRETKDVGLQFESIIGNVQSLPPVFNSVIDGMKQQADGARQICDSIVQLGEVAKRTAESLEEFNRSTETLSSIAQGLRSEASVFKVLD